MKGLELLENATEFHNLTVVRMSIKDMRAGQSFSDVVDSRLRVDIDKMRYPETTEGIVLRNAIYEELDRPIPS